MTSLRQPRDVAKRPMMVSQGGDGHDRLMPLLASITAGPDSALKPSTDGAAVESNQQLLEVVDEDEEPDTWCSTDEYDTDLEQTDTNNNGARASSRTKNRKQGTTVTDEAIVSGKPVDFGAETYGESCDRLGITQVQRVVAGLATNAINLKFRSIGPRGAKALAEALAGNSRVETLDVEENGLEGEGAVYIADMLRENSFITAVNMAKNNIGTEGALAFGELLQFNNEIQYLDLSDNGFRDCDAEPLACGIERNERIIYLNLSHNMFSEEGAAALGRAIGTNNSIERLDLSWNRTRKKGAVMLCTGLKRNYCVTSVNLSWNGFDYEGSLAVGEMLRGNKYLREVDISNNRINWEGAILIAKGLKENDTLEILYMGGNPLTMTGVLDILEAVDNSSSIVTYIGFDGIPVNRKIMYTMETIQKHRDFTMTHGGLLESEDILGRRMVLRCDPLKLLVQFLTDKNIRPVDLFRTFDKDKQFRVTREQFIQGLKKAKVPLDDYEIEKVLFRLDTGKEGKISYQRLMKGVKEQLRLNRAEEKQRMLEEKNTNDEHRKLIKMAGLATEAGIGGGKKSFSGSGGSSPRHRGSMSSSSDDEDGGVGAAHFADDHGSEQASNLTRANIQVHQATAVRGGGAVHHQQPQQTQQHGGKSVGEVGKQGGANHKLSQGTGTGSKASLVSIGSTGQEAKMATAGSEASGAIGPSGGVKQNKVVHVIPGPGAGGKKGNTIMAEEDHDNAYNEAAAAEENDVDSKKQEKEANAAGAGKKTKQKQNAVASTNKSNKK